VAGRAVRLRELAGAFDAGRAWPGGATAGITLVRVEAGWWEAVPGGADLLGLRPGDRVEVEGAELAVTEARPLGRHWLLGLRPVGEDGQGD